MLETRLTPNQFRRLGAQEIRELLASGALDHLRSVPLTVEQIEDLDALDTSLISQLVEREIIFSEVVAV